MSDLTRGVLVGICLGWVVVLRGAGGFAGDGFDRHARPGHVWEFPRDHASHPDYRTEWWYFTGWLTPGDEDGSGPPLGYQFTIFRRSAVPGVEPGGSDWSTRQIFLGHRSLIRPEGGSHRADFTISRGHPEMAFADTGVPGRVRLRGWELEVGAEWRIRARTGRRRLDLRLRPTRPPLFHGEGGFSRKGPGPGQASNYYSLTRMRTRGRVRTGGGTVAVSGWSWFDHEFGSSQLAEHQLGWDWLSLRLSDGSDLMVYRLREEGGKPSPHSSMTLRLPSGEVRHLAAEQWSMEPQGRWRSPETGADYPVSWHLRVPSLELDLRVRPSLEDQEMVAPGGGRFTYWEGMVRAEGRRATTPVTGKGFLELTGYAGSLGGRF